MNTLAGRRAALPVRRWRQENSHSQAAVSPWATSARTSSADLGKGAEKRRERLTNGGYAGKGLTGGAGEHGIRREVLQDGLNVGGVPGGGLVLQDGGGREWTVGHGKRNPNRARPLCSLFGGYPPGMFKPR